jgi:hypothetical protein
MLHRTFFSDEARFHQTRYLSSEYLLVGCGKLPMQCIKLSNTLKSLEHDVCCLTIFVIDMNSEKNFDVGHESLGQCISAFLSLFTTIRNETFMHTTGDGKY